MRIRNPIRLNDWGIRGFSIIVSSILASLWGTIELESVGISIPFLRQVVGFIFLSYLPGIALLRVLRIHNLGNSLTVLYAVGLSISILMFVGVLVNTMGGLLSFHSSVSTMPLLLALSSLTAILIFVAYLRDGDFSDSCILVLDIKKVFLTFFFGFIVFLAVIGTFLMNHQGSNVVLLFMLVLIALVIVILGISRLISEEFFPIAVISISASLLFHTSLITPYISGWDIHQEFYMASLVIQNSHWDYTIPYNTNGMLSLVMLAPIMSDICGVDLQIVFKLIYPLFFSLVPLGLYVLFSRKFGSKIAVMSVLFFVSFWVFYSMMISMAREEIGELFLVLILLLLFDSGFNGYRQSLLLFVFSFSLIVSHYALSYYLVFAAFIALPIVYLPARVGLETYRPRRSVLTGRYVALLAMLAFLWYSAVSSSSSVNSAISIVNGMAGAFIHDFLNPQTSEALTILTTQPSSSLHLVASYLHFSFQAMIGVGILSCLLRTRKRGFDRTYLGLAVVFFCIMIGVIVIPYLSSSLGSSRFYHIGLFFLAPFALVGLSSLLHPVVTLQARGRSKLTVNLPTRVFSILIVLFLLFNSGFVYEVTKDNPVSISLNRSIDAPRFNEKEVDGAIWLFTVNERNVTVYGDSYRWLLQGSYEWPIVGVLPANLNDTPPNSYVFLGTFNVVEHKVLVYNQVGVNREYQYEGSGPLLDGRFRIFDNGGAEILL